MRVFGRANVQVSTLRVYNYFNSTVLLLSHKEIVQWNNRELTDVGGKILASHHLSEATGEEGEDLLF